MISFILPNKVGAFSEHCECWNIDVQIENSKYQPQSLKIVIQTGCGYDEVPTLTSLIRARIILNSRD